MTGNFVRAMALAALALTASAGIAQAPAAQQRPAIMDFFANAPVSAARLSPNAKFVAARIGGPGKRDSLIVFNLETGAANAAASFANADIDNFQWISDERLVLDTTDRRIGQAHVFRAPGLYAVNGDGSAFQQLVLRDSEEGMFSGGHTRIVKTLLPWNHFMLDQRGSQNSENVFVVSPSYEGDDIRFVALKRLNT